MVTACQNSIFSVPALPRAPLAAAALVAALLELAAVALLAAVAAELAVVVAPADCVDAPVELAWTLLPPAPLLAVPIVDDTVVAACPPQLASSVARGMAMTPPTLFRKNRRRATAGAPPVRFWAAVPATLTDVTSRHSCLHSATSSVSASAPLARTGKHSMNPQGRQARTARSDPEAII